MRCSRTAAVGSWSGCARATCTSRASLRANATGAGAETQRLNLIQSQYKFMDFHGFSIDLQLLFN